MSKYYEFWEKFFDEIGDEDLELIANVLAYKSSYAKEFATMANDEMRYRIQMDHDNDPNYPDGDL
jgi:hypothetical protein